MPSHPDDLVLATWLDGGGEPPAATADHVTRCPTCQERLALLAAEARDWGAALALTVDEVAYLRQADLPGRLAAAVAAEAAVARFSAGARQLAVLLALALSVAFAWALLTPALDATLRWVDDLIDVPTLTILLVAQVMVSLTGMLALLAAEPIVLLSNQATLLAASLAVILVWWRRPRLASRPAA